MITGIKKTIVPTITIKVENRSNPRSRNPIAKAAIAKAIPTA